MELGETILPPVYWLRLPLVRRLEFLLVNPLIVPWPDFMEPALVLEAVLSTTATVDEFLRV